MSHAPHTHAPSNQSAPANAIAPAGIYVHWPFCERKCPYCDFYTFGREHPSHALQAQYLNALIAEIESLPRRLNLPAGRPVDTVYFGGGTPSLMGPDAMQRILAAINTIATLAPDPEITLEVNPTTAEAMDLAGYRALGVNRLSVGVQSFNDRILAQLGRVHDAATTRRALAQIQSAGIDNLSLDLIFAAPTQSLDDFKADLEAVLAFNPAHISAYNLTIHEGTPYARYEREGRLALPDEDAAVAMFEWMIDRLAAAGFDHYEISNWARPGRRSRHNVKYWRQCDILGLGVSAHGVLGPQRYENPRDLKRYLEKHAWSLPIDPPQTTRARLGEIMMLALRRVDGVAWTELDDWLATPARDFYRDELARLTDEGFLHPDPGRLCLTRRGILLADTVMEAFF